MTTLISDCGLRISDLKKNHIEATKSEIRNPQSAMCGTRHLTLLFQRNPDRDDQLERIRYEGYRVCWPNGELVTIGLSRFCQQGCRLLGLGKKMVGREQLLELGLHPVSGLEAPFPHPGRGIRSRRFYLHRYGTRGKMFFFNGSPTEAEFDAENDDPRILAWLGLRTMAEGENLWFDLSARTLPADVPATDHVTD